MATATIEVSVDVDSHFPNAKATWKCPCCQRVTRTAIAPARWGSLMSERVGHATELVWTMIEAHQANCVARKGNGDAGSDADSTGGDEGRPCAGG